MPVDALQKPPPMLSEISNNSSKPRGSPEDKKGSRLNHSVKFSSMFALGVGGAGLINYLLPPSSFRASVFRYAICQLPTGFYYLSSKLPDPNDLAMELNQELQKSARHSAGIGNREAVCAASCAAWLENPKSLLLDLNKEGVYQQAYEAIYKKGESHYTNLLMYLESKGWRRAYKFDFIPYDPKLKPTISSIETPIDRMADSDAALCIMKSPVEGVIAHVSTLVKKSESEFSLYDSDPPVVLTSSSPKGCLEQLLEIANSKEMYLYRLITLSRNKVGQLPPHGPQAKAG